MRVVTVTPDPLSGRELAAFVAAVDAHTLYAAADALALTQSAVTKRIAALERRVGQPLLERGRSGVRPTAAGRALYPEARAALAALERARRARRRGRRRRRRSRSRRATRSRATCCPSWLAGFRAERGTLRIAVEVVNSPGVLAAVRGGRAELGFVEGIDSLDGPRVADADDGRARVRGAPGPPLRAPRGDPPRRAARRALDRARAGLGHPRGRRARARERGIVLVPALEAASTEGLKRAVLGGGFALLSRLAVEEEVANGAARRGAGAGPRPAPRAARRAHLGTARPGLAPLGVARDPRTSPMMRAVADPTELLALAERAARAAGDLLRERVAREATGLAYKSSATDPVSDADRDAEAEILRAPARGPAGRRGARRGGHGDARARAGCAGSSIRSTERSTTSTPSRPSRSRSRARTPRERSSASCTSRSRARPSPPCAAAARGATACGSRSTVPSRWPGRSSPRASRTSPSAARCRAQIAARLLPRVRDIRRAGSAALDLAWVACGRLDGYYEHGLNEWDWAGGALLVQRGRRQRAPACRRRQACRSRSWRAPPTSSAALAAELPTPEPA